MSLELRNEHEELWYTALELYLEGFTTPASMRRELLRDGGEKMSPTDTIALQETVEPLFKKMVDSGQFMQDVRAAKADASAAVVGRIKRGLHRHARQMERLSRSSDARVSFSATQDLLNRGETSPKSKSDVGPGAWLQALKDQGLLKEGKDGPEPHSD